MFLEVYAKCKETCMEYGTCGESAYTRYSLSDLADIEANLGLACKKCVGIRKTWWVFGKCSASV